MKTQRQIEIDRLVAQADRLEPEYWLHREALVALWKRINRLCRLEFDSWYEPHRPNGPNVRVRLQLYKEQANVVSQQPSSIRAD